MREGILERATTTWKPDQCMSLLHLHNRQPSGRSTIGLRVVHCDLRSSPRTSQIRPWLGAVASVRDLPVALAAIRLDARMACMADRVCIRFPGCCSTCQCDGTSWPGDISLRSEHSSFPARPRSFIDLSRRAQLPSSALATSSPVRSPRAARPRQSPGSSTS